MPSVTRAISPSMAGILEQLEIDQPALVTTAELAEIANARGVRTPAKVIAARLRERGWLLPTTRRGVYEFAPAAVAGPFSRQDPVTPLRAFLADAPDARAALTFQAAAWAYGLADRVPSRIEVAAADRTIAKRLPDAVDASVFDPRLPYQRAKAVPVLAPESVLVHMAARPTEVRSWSSALEWLPGVAAGAAWPALATELHERASTVRARTGYLISGMRPDLADAIEQGADLHGKTWFGPRRTLVRHDSRWGIADTILPFDPRRLGSVA